MKYYRTMQEAFGPYTSDELTTMDDEHRGVIQALVVACVATVALIAAIVMVVLA